jgi:hypothetical protein
VISLRVDARLGACGALAVALLAASLLPACRSAAHFTPELPAGLPDVRTWEKSEGVAELDDPRRVVEYELYVGPVRKGVYGVTRYRITLADPEARRTTGVTANEKLQWDVDGREVRRFECLAGPAGRPAPCRWTEYARGSTEYDAEMRPLLSVYALHSALLRRRDAERGR